METLESHILRRIAYCWEPGNEERVKTEQILDLRKVKPKVYFNKLTDIYDQVCTALIPHGEHMVLFYQNAYKQSDTLHSKISKIAVSAAYAELYCTNWICGICYSTEHGVPECEETCAGCGVIGENIGYWNNQDSTGSPISGGAADGKLYDNYVVRRGSIRMEKFQSALSETGIGTETCIQLKRDFDVLESRFNANKETLNRKNFFTNKIILQRLLEHYKLTELMEI